MPMMPQVQQVQPLQLQDPLQSYARVAQIQGYQQANQLNQLKMQEAQRNLAARNALNQAYSGALDPNTGEVNLNQLRSSLATGGFGSQIPTVEKGILELQKERAGLRKSQIELVKDKLEAVKPLYQQALGSQNPGAAMLEIHSAVHADPDLGPWLESMGATAERGQQDLMAAISQGPQAIQQKILTSLASVDKLLPSLVSTDTGGGTQLGTRNQLTGAYTPTGVIAKTPLPASVMAQKQGLAAAAAPKTTVSMVQEKALEAELGKNIGKQAAESQANAEEARLIIDTNNVARGLLDAGAITGTGADFLVGLNQALQQAGIDFGYADAAANSRAYTATLGANVGKLIKQFGAGTGLSDADRSFAERMAGGDVSLSETALRRILDINDRAARNVIKYHNKKYGGLKTAVPLTVEVPAEYKKPAPASAPAQIPDDMNVFPEVLRSRPDAAELEMLWQDMTPEDRAVFME